MPVEKRDFSCKRNERDIYRYIIRVISTQVNEIFKKFMDTSSDVLVKSYRLWYDVTNHEKRGGIDHDRY